MCWLGRSCSTTMLVGVMQIVLEETAHSNLGWANIVNADCTQEYAMLAMLTPKNIPTHKAAQCKNVYHSSAKGWVPLNAYLAADLATGAIGSPW